MSIVMVGPYPGPFDRTHYSDSSSESQGDRHHWRPRLTAPPQPQPRSLTSTPERSSQLVPRESVTYRPSQSDSASAHRSANAPLTYSEPLSSQPPELPRKSRITAIKRKCYELLWHLGAFALLAVVVAVLVVATVSHGRVPPEVAPNKGANVVSGANATRDNDTVEEKRPGHSVEDVNTGPKAKPRRHRGGGNSRRGLPDTSAAPVQIRPTTSDRTARPQPTPNTTSSAGADREARTAAYTRSNPTATEEVAGVRGVAPPRASPDTSVTQRSDVDGRSPAESGTATTAGSSPPPSWSVDRHVSPPAVNTTSASLDEVSGGVDARTDVQEVLLGEASHGSGVTAPASPWP